MAQDPTPREVIERGSGRVRIAIGEPDGPIGRSPERDGDSVGSRLYKIAAPMLGHADAERVRQIANLIDSTPAVAESVSQAWARVGAKAEAAGQGQGQAPRGSTMAIAILSTALAALLVVIGVAVAVWAGQLRADVLERSRSQDAEIAEIRLDATEDAAKAAGRQDAQDKQQAAMQARLDMHDKQIDSLTKLATTLTKHTVSRMDAIGSKVGADKLDSWTETPASLRIVALQDDVAQGKRE